MHEYSHLSHNITNFFRSILYVTKYPTFGTAWLVWNDYETWNETFAVTFHYSQKCSPRFLSPYMEKNSYYWNCSFSLVPIKYGRTYLGLTISLQEIIIYRDLHVSVFSVLPLGGMKDCKQDNTVGTIWPLINYSFCLMAGHQYLGKKGWSALLRYFSFKQDMGWLMSLHRRWQY